MSSTRTTTAPARRRLLVGAAAAFVSGGAMMAARVLAEARTPVDMIFDLTSHLLGVPVMFNLIHALPWGLGGYAKYALFVVMALLYLGLWSALALPLLRLGRAWRVVVPALATPALVGLVLLPLEGLGLFGTAPGNYFYPPLSTALWAAGFGVVYGLVLALFPAHGSATAAHDASRRSVLGRSGQVMLAVVAGVGVARLLLGAVVRAAGLDGLLARIKGLSAPITATEDHYVVSKNFLNPGVKADRWSLKIHGMVDHPLTLGLEDIKALPSVERSTTLTCISNEVGGDLIGNSLWTGVPMRDLLSMAGVQSGATEVILRAADNYSDSFPLEVGMREGTMVAYFQNGEALTRDHGFPARVLAPGIYGMKNVKWVVEIELADQDYQGYWQQRGWSDEAVVQTMSRIDTATATMLDDGTAAIGGIAFAGLRGVEEVEVSLDGGSSWQRATVRPAENDFSWTLWGFQWQADPGEYQVQVRAVDGTGTSQTAERQRPLPDGATGHHQLKVRVG